jgi:phosphoribosylanthranilate isomerase
VPWMLAGGLTAENVADAIRITGAQQVDVSSGVERKRGAKDPEKIREFLETVQNREETQASS